MSQSDITEARRLAREVVAREDTTITVALLADAVGHLTDELERTRNRLDGLRELVDEQEGRRIAAAEGRRYD